MSGQQEYALRDFYKNTLDGSQQGRLCGCIGPQKGQPLCPCGMRGVIVKNGRYVRPEQDLGPAGIEATR